MNAELTATLTEKPAAEDQARAEVYAMLANLFYQSPDVVLLDVLAQAGDINAIAPEATFAQAWLDLQRASIAMDAEAMVESVAEEFQMLFIGHGSGGEAIPYASWHLTGFMMEEPLAHLRDDLNRLGFTRLAGVSEPEDHAAALFEVMRLLVLSAPLPAQKDFYCRHLAPWCGKLAAQLANAPSANYYRHVADLLRAFIEVEAQGFEMVEA